MSRGAVFYVPRPTSPAELDLMRCIDELHLESPYMGVWTLRRQHSALSPIHPLKI